MTTPAREEILARLRTALRDVPAEERPEDVRVERAYRTADPAPRETLVARFVERVEDYRATVTRVRPGGIAAAVAAACRERGARRLVVPPDLPEEWRPTGDGHGVELLADEGLDLAALDGVDGVLTGCAVAVADTGTIVLDSGARQGRRAITLLPDWHLCVVEAGQVVGSVPEALAACEAAVRAGRPLTFVSGPSATSDIELRRVEGVHGPRTLHVLLVG